MQKIRIDFDNPGLPQHISAVENDSQSRFFQATLYENGKAYTAPEGATYSIMYRGFGPQNQGWYDTINDGAGKRAACAVSGNVVTCEIARQALQVPGHVSIVLCVTTGKGYMLKSWPIECDCKNDRYDSTVEIQSFFYITQVSNADWTQAIQVWENLKDTIDPTLSVSGKAADAAKVGEAVGQVKEDVEEFTGNKKIVYQKDMSISNNPPVKQESEAGWESALVPCEEKDIFYVKGEGGMTTRLFIVFDKNGKVLFQSEPSAIQTEFVEVTIPQNGAFLAVNSNYTNIAGETYKNPRLRKEISDLKKALYYKVDAKFSGETSDYIVKLSNKRSVNSLTGNDVYSENRAYAILKKDADCKYIKCETGYRFYLYGNNDGINYPFNIVDGWETGTYDIQSLNYKYILIVVANTDDTVMENVTGILAVGKYDKKLDYATKEDLKEFRNTKYYNPNLFFRPANLMWFDGIGDYNDFVQKDGEFAGYSKCTTEEYHTKFNNLVKTYGFKGISSYNLGKDASGEYDIFAYSLTNSFTMQDSSVCRKRPKIFVTSVHHGYEKGSAYALYYLFKHLALDWSSNKLLSYLYLNFDWYIIPIINPWGWNNYVEKYTDAETKVGYLNSNGVNLARGYNNPYETYQPEQKLVYDFIDKNKENAAFIIDFHTNGTTRDPNSVPGYSPSNKNWIDIDTGAEIYPELLSLVTGWTSYFTENVSIPYWGVLQRCSFVTIDDDSSKGYITWLAEKLNVPSVIFEGTHKCYNDPSKKDTEGYQFEEHEFAPVVIKYCEIEFSNFIAMALKYFGDKYNS